MFHKILVALDYSEFASPIFDEAISLAKIMGAQLRLLHVVSLEDGFSYQPSVYLGGFYSAISEQQLDLYQEQWTEFKTRNLQRLEADTETAKSAGISAEFCQLFGSPGRNICEFAQSWGADLILMGRHGRTGISELFLGSVSNYVLHHAHCAVLTLNTSTKHHSESAQAESLTAAT